MAKLVFEPHAGGKQKHEETTPKNVTRLPPYMVLKRGETVFTSTDQGKN